MKFVEKAYKYNKDGSVRVEFFTKEDGMLPLGYFTELVGVKIADRIQVDKRGLRGLVLDAKHVNDDGLICDENGNPVETEDYQKISGKKIEKWDQHFWVSRNGQSVLDDEEIHRLPSDDRANYRKVRCVEINSGEPWILGGQIYISEEATPILAELLMQDVCTNDPIIGRYDYECCHNEVFAAKFGFALEMGKRELHSCGR